MIVLGKDGLAGRELEYSKGNAPFRGGVGAVLLQAVDALEQLEHTARSEHPAYRGTAGP